MHPRFAEHLSKEIDQLKQDGLYKEERPILSAQSSAIRVGEDADVINLCANNYLGLANDPGLIAAAKDALDRYGYGMASVRFICGTQDLHRQLETKLSDFLGMEHTILYSSCFDANAGLFETLLGPEDAIISDGLNHASIIDGVRLCKAQRFRYANNDMTDLEKQLKAAQSARFRLVATDGVFSMDGIIANLPDIVTLAKKYDAMVMVDDSHAVGFMGPGGQGTPAHFGLTDEIDILTGTLGKALGGASGGYTSARGPIVEWLRQRSRPYLFSNSLAPVITATSLAVLERLEQSTDRMQRLHDNAAYFRAGMTEAGFTLVPGEHPIIPVMTFDARTAVELSARLLERHLYVIGFSYPVVPKGQARIRTQMSAAHTTEQLSTAITAFTEEAQAMGLLSA